MADGDPKDRIVRAALACFAEKGYAATSMADIEAVAGFVPRTGGTYRHFRSKRAILDAVIDAELDRTTAVLAPAPTSFEGAARDGLAELDRQRALMRVLFRDLDQFPELMARVADRLVQQPYRIVTERTAAVAPNADAAAIAAIMIGALVNYKVIEAMVGDRPAGVTEDRLVAAWARLYQLAIEDGVA